MSAPEIMDKLRAFLAAHDPMSEECHAVYLMVELRKITEHFDVAANFPIFVFYADWTVHTAKDRRHGPITKIANDMVAEVRARPGLPRLQPVVRFASMQDLRREIAPLLKSLGLDPSLALDDHKWRPFVGLLSEVLANQPINDPTPDVRCITIRPGGDVCELVLTDNRSHHLLTR